MLKKPKLNFALKQKNEDEKKEKILADFLNVKGANLSIDPFTY